MKKFYFTLCSFLLLLLFSNYHSKGQGTPELLYYKFNDTGRSIKNYASSPPRNTQTATINGGINQGIVAGTCGGKALEGTGTVSTTDYIQTYWKDSLIGTSWTVSFWTRNLDSSTALYYLFSDPNAGNFRAFMGGASGAGNIFLRGPFTDVLLTGGSGKLPRVSTFVYDANAGYIYAYLNGKLINSVAQSSITINSSGSFILCGLGGSATYGGLNPNGVMDEFRFYNRALSATEVSKLLYYGNTSATVNQVVCGASSFRSPSGKYTWTKDGTYRDTMLNKGNCDSFMTINLSFGNNSSSSLTVTACDFYVSPSKSVAWTKTGTYTDKIKNRGGCDSIITVYLTINNSTYKTLNVNTCGPYKSPSGKYTWNTSGQHNDTLKNKKNCDSLITVNLKIGYTTTSTLSVKACDSYRSPSKKRTWFQSGQYKDTLINTTGCDSLITINLTLGKTSFSALNVKACDKYTIPSKKRVLTQSGQYSDTLINKSGCDSVVNISLIVSKSSYAQINPNTCSSYTSPSGKYKVSFSTSFFDTIPNRAGCDSIILIDVKVNPSTSKTISATVCNRYLSPSKRYVWKVSGKYIDTTVNSKGCDSIVTVNLTVNSVNVVVTQNKTKLTALLGGMTYQWLNCSSNYSKIPGATGQSYIVTAVGKYAVEIFDGSCTDTSTCFNITDLKVSPTLADRNLAIIPNPTRGQFELSASKPFQSATLSLFNSIGEEVYRMDRVDGSRVRMDLSSQSNGIYFLEIIEKGERARIKLVKY